MRQLDAGSIVAVRGGGLGDLLVAWPSLRLLRLSFPGARIILVSRPEYGRLLREEGSIDRVEDAGDFSWACLSGSGRPFPAALSGADSVVGWFHSDSADGFLAGTALVRPERPVRAFRADARSGEPISRQFFELTSAFCAEAGVSPSSFESCARLSPPASLPPPAAALSRPYIVVHPGSGSPAKLWPGERFREVVEFSAGRGFSGAVVLGEAELDIRSEWRAIGLPPGWILLDRPLLSTLAAFLSGAAAYFGNDSGVTHLAAALGIPGLALFRSEFIRAWRPYGRIATLEALDVRDIPVSAALEKWSAIPNPGPFVV